MKLRSDFVTNSSSSSFVLVFKDEDDYRDFYTRCDDFGYRQFYRLIDRMKSEDTDKTEALAFLRGYYCHEVLDDIAMLEAYAKAHGLNKRWYEVREEAEADPKYMAELERCLAETDYAERKKQIEDAQFVVNGQIWDSNGGLLEWAIRHDFIKDNFWQNHICTWHVG